MADGWIKNETIYYGDCLEVLKDMRSEQVDLIYLDPPFNSKRNYNTIFGSDLSNDEKCQFRAFTDTWHWGDTAAERVRALKDAVGNPAHDVICGLEHIHGPSTSLSYLSYMAPRLVELKRVLKPTGTIYLHCDPTMSHSLKLMMDGIFDAENFRNEIIWQYDGPQRPSKKNFGSKHDVILRYSKSASYMSDEQGIAPFRALSSDELSEYKKLSDGRYYYTTPRGDYTDKSIKKIK